MKKIAKKAFGVGLLLCICTLFFAMSYVAVMYVSSDINFDKTKITDSNLQINLFDSENIPLKHTFLNGDYIGLELIPTHTINSFISIEDKDFYKHNGLNYKRMVGAMAKNITSLSFKEGASTISQQLIKNTHLTNEKTMSRKINEIKLTKKLEKAFTKDQILEYYLNIIYFGDNCYGIQNASQHYFSHSASKLTLDESAMLAGIIKSPNKYHPVKNYDKCLKRRNLVLSELKNDGLISNEEYIKAKNTKTEVSSNPINTNMSAYSNAVINEACNILKMPEKQIAIGEYKIFTYQNKQKQSAMDVAYNLNSSCDIALISINAKTGGIEAYSEKGTMPLINVKRQPASAIKPTLVYAPAINENIISPSTEILDDDVSINGYSPKNIGDKKYGYVSATEALSKSLNIPAVKVLSYVGIDKAIAYMERQNIQFDKNDNNLALALGGMTYGMTLKDLTNTYQTLANGGNYIQAKFISHIIDKNGKVIYKNSQKQTNIYRDDTAFLTTCMLKETAKKGTAKRMSDLPFEIASKTGTSSLSKNNLDAYNISYTTEDVVGCWMGKLDNSKIDVVGGGEPTVYVKNYLSEIYKECSPQNFNIPSSVVLKEIDSVLLQEEHKVYLADDYLPDRYKQKAYFSRFNTPKQKELTNLTITAPKIEAKAKNGVANITFIANPKETYELYLIINNRYELIEKVSGKNGKTEITTLLPQGKICMFAIKAKIINYKTNEEIYSDFSNIVELYSG